MGVVGKKWTLAKRFDGAPKDGDLKLETFELPPLKDGEVLLKAEFLSVDPYMRPFTASLPLGEMMIGESVSEVIESQNPEFPVGTYVRIMGGWTTHVISDGTNLTKLVGFPSNLPRSYALGVLGMPGVAAYFGFLEICDPIKAGETVLVSAAAGAVGSIVGQIAKIKGCKVIGSAGSDAKIAYLKEIGFDEAFNYKTTQDLDATIKSLAPNGVDIYFDNVGGTFSTTVVKNMNNFGRMSCCGSVSTYNQATPEKVDPIFLDIIMKQLTVKGFATFFRYMDRFSEAITPMAQWIKEGNLKVSEHVTGGFENMDKAFYGLFSGDNIGKAIVKV